MPKFGQYETGRLLYRTGFDALYLWQPGKKGSRRCIIKAYQPSVRVRNERLAAAQSDAFLDSAGVQQKAAREDARYWAPIHECGVSPEGVFYATDYYDVSAQQLIDGRVNLGPAGLCRIVESVARGLLALKRACGRPHGNLKFTNILIARRRLFRKERIVLTDPCPSSQLDMDTHARMDLKQLGALIHQLVMHRNPPLIAGYQAPDSQEWQKLGRHADAWRDLCNRLLAMDVEAKPITLEELVARLPGVAHRGWRRLLKAFACLCVIALFVVLYRPVGDLVRDRLWPTTPEEARMAYLQCAEARTWLSELWHKLDPSVGGQRFASWKEDESLATLLDCLEIYGRPFEKSEDVRLVIPEMPDEAKLAGNGRYRKEIRNANEARVEIEALLFGETRRWSLPGRLSARATGLRQASCESMAAYMDALLASIDRHEDLAERIDDVLYLKNNWYEADYANLEPNAVMADTSLTGAVRDAEDLVSRLHRLSDHHRVEIGEYTGLLAAQKRLANLLKEVTASGDPEGERLQAGLEAIVVGDIVAIRSIPFTRANAPRVTERCRSAQNALEKIEQQIEGADDLFDKWRGPAAGRISSSPAINRAYSVRLDAWLGGDRLAFADRYKGRWSDLRLLRNKVDQTRKNLLSLDASPSLPKTIAPKETSAPWIGEIRTYYENTKRESLLIEITGMLVGREVFPDTNGYPDECGRLLNWHAEATNLIGDFGVIESCVNAWYGFTETADGPSVQGRKARIKDLYDTWRGTSLLKELEVSGSLVNLVGRVQMLERIEVAEARNELVDMARQSPPEAAYAIWRRLDVVDPNWPSELEQWQLAQKIQENLNGALTTLPQDELMTPGRIELLKRELEETLKQRKNKFLLVEIARDTGRVKARAGADPLLEKVVGYRLSLDDGAEYIEEYSSAVKSLAGFVGEPNWPESYDLLEFDKEEGKRFFSEPLTPAVIHAWLGAIRPHYIIIPDAPAGEMTRWDARVNRLQSEITEGLEEARVTGDRDAEDKLNIDETDLGNVKKAFDTARRASIKKYESEFQERKRLLDITLPGLESRVESHLRPRYCRRLQVSGEGEVVFRSGLKPDVFKPVMRVPSQPGPAYLTDEFVVLRARALNEFRDRNSELWKTYPNVLGDNGYFGTKDFNDVENPNLGWPKYIRAVKDPNVILRFVPQDDDGDPPPFYMAVRETTNAQFSKFLMGSKSGNGMSQRRKTSSMLLDFAETCYRLGIDPKTDKVRDELGGDLNVGERYSGIKDHPVVWVTFEGATEYTRWLLNAENAGLPKVSWHRRAAFYADPRSSGYADPKLYHMRAEPYWQEVERWRDHHPTPKPVQNGTEIIGDWETSTPTYPPEGIVHEATSPKPPVVRERGIYSAAFPMASQSTQLVLSDLLGNVWEWCEDSSGKPVICGGSCLSPLEWIGPEAAMPAPGSAGCDLGFRVAIQCP